jgi:toxin ParE1/3/4
VALKVLLSDDAERDIEGIYRYVAEHDAVETADRLLVGLEQTCDALSEFPQRGDVPKELRTLGITEYRQVHLGPYRVIYRVMGRRVVVHCVLDGRRDMQVLLQRRLLR